MEDVISRAEHEAFVRECESEHKRISEVFEAERKRLEDEDERQNHRLHQIEQTLKELGALASSVEKMAVNMENMLQELKQQSKRLEVIESRDGEKWRTVVSHIVTTVVGALVCYVLTHIGV